MALGPLTLEGLRQRSFGDRDRLAVRVTDGKAVGTYVEATFNAWITRHLEHRPGNAALGIDFPELEVDLKVTSIKQPPSSCPFRNATQKVYGLGYHLLSLRL